MKFGQNLIFFCVFLLISKLFFFEFGRWWSLLSWAGSTCHGYPQKLAISLEGNPKKTRNFPRRTCTYFLFFDHFCGSLRLWKQATKPLRLKRTEGMKKSVAICMILRKHTHSSHLKLDGWNTSFLLGWPTVGFRECILHQLHQLHELRLMPCQTSRKHHLGCWKN